MVVTSSSPSNSGVAESWSPRISATTLAMMAGSVILGRSPSIRCSTSYSWVRPCPNEPGVARLLAVVPRFQVGAVPGIQLAPDQCVALLGDEGLPGALSFELQPVGAALAELLGSEREDGVAQERQQSEHQHGPKRGPHDGDSFLACRLWWSSGVCLWSQRSQRGDVDGSQAERPDQLSSQTRWASAARLAAAVAAWTVSKPRWRVV